MGWTLPQVYLHANGGGADRSQGALWLGSLPQALLTRLENVAAQERVTLQGVLLAAFTALLGAANPKVTLGVPVDLRAGEVECEPIGYFINLLPLRAQWNPALPFRQWLRQRFEDLFDALEHRTFPFSHLVGALAATGGDAPKGLDVAFYFLTWPNAARRRLFASLEAGIHQCGEFPLVFEFIEGEGDGRLHIKYRPSVYPRATIEALGATYLALLEAVVAQSDARLADLPALAPKETEVEVEADASSSSMRFPEDRTVDRLIEEQVERTPDALAVIFAGRERTYAALDAEANQWAHYFLQKGVGAGALVGVMLPRSGEMLIALLALWKIGAAYVPLDPSYPRERIATIVEDARLPFLVSHSSVGEAERGSGVGAKLLFPADEADLIARQPVSRPLLSDESWVDPAERLAYVIYTSGSTGRPKGVQIAHRSLAHFLWCMAERPGCGPGDRIAALTTISFDIAALELFLPLVSGASVEILPEAVTRNGRRLREVLEHSPVTLVQATPATWKMLLLAELPPLPRLKALCGGEAWDEELAGELLPRVGELWNMYGPTETTIWSSIAKVEPGEPVRLGEPIGNTRFYVLDEALRPVPKGEIGELYIGGEGLAKGYLHRPELTRERFMAHPQRPEEMIYRTGDLVRYV